jgi:hypothetical protein
MTLGIDSIGPASSRSITLMRAFRRLGIALTVIGLCGCTTAGMFSPNVQLYSDKDKVSSTTTAQQSSDKNSASGACATIPKPTLPNLTEDSTAKQLVADFDAVRVEHGIVRIAIDPDAYRISPAALLAEVKALRNAKTLANANADLPTTLDPVEMVLVSKLPPWAGDQNMTLSSLVSVINAGAADAASGVAASTDELSQPAKDAISAASDVLKLGTEKALPLNALLHAAHLTTSSAEEAKSSSFGRSDHKRLFNDLQTLQVLRTFHFLTLLSAAQLHKMMQATPLPSDPEIQTEIRIFNWARFLSTYFDAYFRSGHFLAVTDSGNPILKLGTDGFVSRAGMSVQFAGIDYALTTNLSTVSLHHNYPAVAQFGPQLVRVFVEALFDANGLSPMAVSNSTACAQHLFDETECLGSAANNSPEAKNVIEQIDLMASASEALTTAATGAILRGVNVVALNNEAVAQVLETLVGVNARKITEKLVYSSSVRDGLVCPAQAAPAALTVQ